MVPGTEIAHTMTGNWWKLFIMHSNALKHQHKAQKRPKNIHKIYLKSNIKIWLKLWNSVFLEWFCLAVFVCFRYSLCCSPQIKASMENWGNQNERNSQAKYHLSMKMVEKRRYILSKIKHKYLMMKSFHDVDS